MRMPSPAKRSSVPSYSTIERAHRRVEVLQHRLDLFRLGGVGERGEAAQVDEHVADLPAVRSENRLFARRNDGVGDGRGEEALELGHALELRHLLGDSLLELRVPFLQRLGLPLHLVLQRFHAQQRAHAGEELGLVDRLRQKIVGAGLDALDPLTLRIERGHEDDRQERRRGIGAQVPANVVAGQAGHHHVQQNEVGRFRGDLGERFLAVHGGRDSVTFHAEQVGEQLDVVRRVVDHQHFGRSGHFRVRASVSRTVSRNSLRLIGLPM